MDLLTRVAGVGTMATWLAGLQMMGTSGVRVLAWRAWRRHLRLCGPVQSVNVSMSLSAGMGSGSAVAGAGAVLLTVLAGGTGGGSVSTLRGGTGSNLVGGASTLRGGAGSEGAGGAATLRGDAVSDLVSGVTRGTHGGDDGGLGRAGLVSLGSEKMDSRTLRAST